MVYDLLNNPFKADFGRIYVNLPPINIDDRPHPHKRAPNNPDLLTAAIYVVSEDSVSTLTTHSDLPRIFILTSAYLNPIHVINKEETYLVRVKKGYYCRKNDEKRCYKNIRFYCST